MSKSEPSGSDWPELTAEQILEAVSARWWLLPLPHPRGDWLRCPVCRSRRVQPRQWRLGRRDRGDGPEAPAHRLSYRCDVSYKCTECSAVWPHGVPLTRAQALRIDPAARTGVRVWHWRDAAGLFDRNEKPG